MTIASFRNIRLSYGYQGGSNLYAYVNNDPLNLVDPSGQLSVGGIINFTLKQQLKELNAVIDPENALGASQIIEPFSRDR
jgi:hypothetical protein